SRAINGCFSFASVLISRAKRCRRAGDSPAWGRNLIATRLPVSSRSASQTTPIPPSPNILLRRYGPTWRKENGSLDAPTIRYATSGSPRSSKDVSRLVRLQHGQHLGNEFAVFPA